MLEGKYESRFAALNKESNEEYLSGFIKLVGDLFYERVAFVKNSTNDDKRKEFYDYLKGYIMHLYNEYKEKTNSNISLSDYLTYISHGHTALAFKIGNDVLKITKTKGPYTPNKTTFSCYIPIFFEKNFEVSESEYYTIQTCPYVNTEKVEEEDVYSLYRIIRSAGYIWNDPAPKNVGTIIEDIEYNGVSYKKGDHVIFDFEDFAYVGEVTSDIILDEIATMSYNPKVYAYEMRYIEEKKRESR